MKNKSDLDVVFVYPPLSVQERYGNRNIGDVGGHVPPLGIMSLAAYIREKGYSADVIDAVISNLSTEGIINYIRAKKPKIVGFSAITPIFYLAVDCATKIKKEFPELLTILGGHHASVLTKDIIKNNKCFDLVVFGEGELTMLEILDLYKSKDYDFNRFLKDYELLKTIEGISFRKEEDIIINRGREFIQNVDELPYPARDLLPIEKFIPLPNQYKRLPTIHMVVVRGCPYQCSFCSNNTIFGRKIRARSPQKVIDEIEFIKTNYGAKEISFWDDMLTANKRWTNEFCDLIIKNKIDVIWTCYSRVDTVTKELLRKMKSAGCWNIFFGFESGDQQLLNNINKGITLEQIIKATRWCKEIGIEIRASFMLALPGETPELARKTIDFAKKLSPEYAQFCITTPYPGTKLFNEVNKWGSLLEDYSKFNIWEPVFIPFGYRNRQQITNIEKRAHFEFYFRLRAAINLIKKIRSWEDVKRYFKGVRMAMGFIR